MSRTKRRFKTSRLKKTAIFRYFVMPLATVWFIGFSFVMKRLPPRCIYWSGRFFGLIVWMSSAKRRNIALRNLEIAFGNGYTVKERRRIARRSVQHFCITALEVFLLPRYVGDAWMKRVNLTDEQREKFNIMAAHKGPVALHTGHMGSWEFSTGIINYTRRPLAAVYRPLELPAADREIRCLRMSQGIKVYAKKGALRGYVKTLKNNEWLGVIADQNAGSDAEFVNFFGVPAATEAGYFTLYSRFDTLICSFFMIRDGFRFKYSLEGLCLTKIEREADPAAEKMRLAQWYMNCLEKVVRAHPEQYNWLHRRWRSRPAGVPSLYKNLGQPLDPKVLKSQPPAPLPRSS